MVEGTKLGEFNEDQEFKTAVEHDASKRERSGTKIGEVSEFEKSLLESNATQVEAPAEAPKQQETVSEDAEDEDDVVDFNDFESEFEKELGKIDVDFCEGDVVEGVVRSVEKSGVIVDIGYKSDGFIPNNELSDFTSETDGKIKAGDKISACIVKLETKEGYTVLSSKRAEFELAWNEISDLAKSRKVIEIKVDSKVEGGLVASYCGIRGFIPASQVIKDSEEDLDAFIGKGMNVAILRSDRKRRKVIFSHKLAQNRMKKEEAFKIIDDLEIGQVRDGRVTSIKDFGAFVDLGGIEGLVHISELSWARISHPKDVLNIGDDVKVFILGVDKETKRISLGMKQLEPDPWVEVMKAYEVGQTVEGEITRLVPFGAFLKINDNIEGLIHISELTHDHVVNVDDVVKVGDTVKAKIIKLVPDEQKIGLSMKELIELSSEATETAQTEETVVTE